MTKLLYAWDELSDELVDRDPEELREANEEGQWRFVESLPNGVAVMRTDRHWALEVWAESILEAHQLMMAFPYYNEWHDGEIDLCKFHNPE